MQFYLTRKLTLLFALTWILSCGMLCGVVSAESPNATKTPPDAAKIKDIKAYCLDFNWQPGRSRGAPFAKPGLWCGADPAKHVAWYKAIGANVIQTFCVSTNGYAWYKNGFVPEQPGLVHDFLPEVVKLGHQEGMLVMGYFCIASNPKWGAEHPDQSYGTPTTYHIPYTDDYLAYLSKSIEDAVRKTGIDGFMIDWVWMPRRKSTEGKWLESEKALYKQLMGEAFPGEDKLTSAQETAYSRKSIDRCWKTIRTAAKKANPKCIVWVTVNKMNHPHVLNSPMYKEADWLMNEAGSIEHIKQVEEMVGEHTRMITCMARWNGQDATEAVPAALAAGVGLYGFTKPRGNDGLVKLNDIFSRQVCELHGDSKNIAVLARAYHGKSVDALWTDGKFVEPKEPPPFRIRLKGRGRGFPDTALISYKEGPASVTIRTPYSRGRALLIRNGKTWPAKLTIRLHKGGDQPATSTHIYMANGLVGVQASLDGSNKASYGKMEDALDLGREWKDAFPLSAEGAKTTPLKVQVTRAKDAIEIVVPEQLKAGNPEVLAIEWGMDDKK